MPLHLPLWTKYIFMVFISILTALQIISVFGGIFLSVFGIILMVQTNLLLGSHPRLLTKLIWEFIAKLDLYKNLKLESKNDEVIELAAMKLLSLSFGILQLNGTYFLKIGVLTAIFSVLGLLAFSVQNITAIFTFGICCLSLFVYIIFFMYDYKELMSLEIEKTLKSLFDKFEGRKCAVCWIRGSVNVKFENTVNDQITNVMAMGLEIFKCCGIDNVNDVTKRFDQRIIPLVCCKYNTSNVDCISGKVSFPSCRNKTFNYFMELPILKYSRNSLIPLNIFLIISSFVAIAISLYAMYDRKKCCFNLRNKKKNAVIAKLDSLTGSLSDSLSNKLAQ